MNRTKRLAVLLLLGLFLQIFAVLGAGSFAVTGEDKIVIVLDPGHGGKESGTCEAKNPEKWYNLKVAQACKAALEKDGRFEVYLTRTGDTELSLMERGMFANSKNADLLISLHFDGRTNTTPHGCAVFASVIPKYQKLALADLVLQKITENTPIVRSYEKPTGATQYTGVNCIRDYGEKIYYWSDDLNWSLPELPQTGPKRDYYGVIKWCAYFGVPSFIVEHAFMSNADDRAFVESADACTKLGEADAAAIIEYYTGHTHTYGERTRDFPSNCMMQGKTSEHCTVCGCRRNVELLAADENAHIWLESGKKAAACGVDGYTEYTCEITRAMNVGKEGWVENHVKKDTIKAEPHDYKLQSEKKAGHGADGSRTYVCSKCKDSYTETVKGEPHQWVEQPPVAATCTESGYNLSICSVCEKEKKVTTDPPTGHDYKLDSVTDPTCEKSGKRVYLCTKCQDKKEEKLDPTGHNWVEVSAIAPTCENDGVLSFSCTACDTTKTEPGETATGHKMEQIGEIPPTCTAPGSRTMHCTACEYETTEEIPASGHSYTLREDGISACAVCGAEEPKEVPGDDPTSGETSEASETGEPTSSEGSSESVSEGTSSEAVPSGNASSGTVSEQSPSDNTASVLSDGSLWLIIAVGLLAVGSVAVVVVKKKKQPAGMPDTDDDE